MKRDIYVLYLAARDPRVPWYVKGLAAVTAAYALSPIDLVPDFIPVLGYLDDFVILPIAVALCVRLIPREVMAQLRAEAAARLAESPPHSHAGVALVITLWIALLLLFVWLVWFR